MKVGHHADKQSPITTVASSPSPSQDAAKTQQAAAATAIPATADPSAKIELSSAASTLLDKQSSADFDAEKVARVSQAIDAGTFKINPEVIADKLISNAKELLSKHST
jgi:negative regulator of flagellin synthesis FlgM